MNEIFKNMVNKYNWEQLDLQNGTSCFECSCSEIPRVFLSHRWNHKKKENLLELLKIQYFPRLFDFIKKPIPLFIALVSLSFFVLGFESKTDFLLSDNNINESNNIEFNNKSSIGIALLDSLMEDIESDILALAEPHDEKKAIESTEKISLIGFYDESIYPSNDLYELWDTSILYPYAEHIRKQDTEIKLIVQDKDNYCNFVPPIEGMVTSNYGPRGNRNHYGIDIHLETSDPIYASFDGMVRIAKPHHSYGNVVIVRHYNGLETVYAHLDKLNVEPGDIINAGEMVGLGGNTGRSTGPHLHYEIRFKGVPLNPNHIISFKDNCLVSDSIKVVRVKNSYVAVPMGVPFHSVKKGEYLFYIARKYGTTVSHLCEINGIHRNKPLQVGQKLRIG